MQIKLSEIETPSCYTSSKQYYLFYQQNQHKLQMNPLSPSQQNMYPVLKSMIEECATQCLKELSDSLDNYQPDHIQPFHSKLHEQRYHKKTDSNIIQNLQHPKKLKFTKSNAKSVWTALPLQSRTNHHDDVSPWNYEDSSTQHDRTSCKTLSHQTKAIQSKQQNYENEHPFIFKNKLTKINRNKQNNSTIGQYSDKKGNGKSDESRKQSQDKNNKENLGDMIELVSVCKVSNKHKNQLKEYLKEMNSIGHHHCEPLKNITSNCHNTQQIKNRVRSQCSKNSLTENIGNNKQLDLAENQGQNYAAGLTQVVGHHDDKRNSKITSNIAQQSKLQNLYRRYSELKKEKSGKSCEKIKKQIVSNIEKEGLVGSYNPGAMLYKSSTNKGLVNYYKNRYRGYCKRSEQDKKKVKKYNRKQQGSSCNSLNKHLSSHKTNIQSENQKNLYYLGNSYKGDESSQQKSKHLTRHLFDKYRIVISRQKVI